MHDGSDNVVAQVTIENSDFIALTQRFMFSGTYDITSGNTYHVHFTSTVADSTIDVSTASDLSTAKIGILKEVSDDDVDQSQIVTNTNIVSYVINTSSISEDDDKKCEFVPEKELQTAISVVGKNPSSATGTLTLTVHDDKDTEIATATLSSSNLKYGGHMQFVFTTPWRAVVGATYHFHITVASGGLNIISSDSSDFNKIEY